MIDDLIKEANRRRAAIKTIDDIQAARQRLKKFKRQIDRIETALNKMESELNNNERIF